VGITFLEGRGQTCQTIASRFVVLAPASSDQVTLLNLTAADKKLAELPEYKALLQNFITQEVSSSPNAPLFKDLICFNALILRLPGSLFSFHLLHLPMATGSDRFPSWLVKEKYPLVAHPTYPFAPEIHMLWLQIAWWWKIDEQYASEMEAETEIFGGEGGAKRKENLQSQVTEHNILVASKFYSQMHLERLAALLDLTQAQVCSLPPFQVCITPVLEDGGIQGEGDTSMWTYAAFTGTAVMALVWQLV